MLTDSIYRNLGKPVKHEKQKALGLNTSAIEIIAGYGHQQLKTIYERYSIKYLMREITAWEKLGKVDVAGVIKNMIEERKEISRLHKMNRLV
jgi:hypothetical protein